MPPSLAATASCVETELDMKILDNELISACLSSPFGRGGETNTCKPLKATTRWLGMSGEWSIAGDWSANSVPGSSDVAEIAATGSYTVTVTAPETVRAASLNNPGATLDVQSDGTLTVGGPLIVRSGVLEIQGSGYEAPGGMLGMNGRLSVRSGGVLHLDGGTIEGGSLFIERGGALDVSPSLPDPGAGGGVLQDVTVLGGLTLNGGALWLSDGTTIESADGTCPGTIILNGSSSYLALGENYTFDDLFLNGGYVAGDGTAATIEKGGLVQGYGGFIFGPFGHLALDNEGIINSNVIGQWLNVSEMPFLNDGFVIASGGGNIAIDYADPYFDEWSNAAAGIISVVDGGKLELGGQFTNYGSIDSVNSTVDFGDPVGPPNSANNAGDMFIFGGALLLGDSYFSDSWTDSGLIATYGAAIDLLGSGTIAASGILRVRGGTLDGTTVEDDGDVRLGGGRIALSSMTIDGDGSLSGFGNVANQIANSGVIVARKGTLNLETAITGNGNLHVTRGAALELGGATAESVTFNAKHASLELDKASEFSGTIDGLAHGDAIDLADFAFSTHPTVAGVAGTGAAGSITDVTVNDGSETVTLELMNHFAGQYSANTSDYSLTSDHHGANAGTLFTLAPTHSPIWK
jgi:hypothetical protein